MKSWTADAVPAGQLVLDRKRTSVTVPVTLPSGAAQGPTTWFTFALRFRVTFAEGGADRGSARVTASVNGGAAALVTLRSQADGVRVFHDGYLGGPRNTVTRDQTTDVVYENYVQTKGIRAGTGSFEISLEDRGALVQDIRIEPASGLYRTAADPEQLAISAPAQIDARVGEPVDLAYALSRRGERADRPVTVAAETAGGPIRLNREHTEYGSVGTGRTGSFQVIAAETGQYQIRLTAQGGYNQPTAVVLVVVKSARSSGNVVQLVAAGGLGLVGVAVLMSSRRRRHG
ncbi:hypothetical protein [Actinoplanes auranticolor]|nr:hypothetical protein [Actinoplanes auranticolor]